MMEKQATVLGKDKAAASEKSRISTAFKAAFPLTIPIMAGFLFIGITYGVYMNVQGFSAIYPIMMSLTIFAGSMEFVAANLLLGMFDPFGALLLAIMVNSRHLFYGLSMLDKYDNVGKKRWYLIFGLCDESFSINCTARIPEGVDKGWFYFFVTILNQSYWVCGAALGGIFGSFIQFELKGLEFVMAALLLVIYLDQWMKEKNHLAGIIGLAMALICRIIFGSESFIIPAMIAILVILTVIRKPLEGRIDSLEESAELNAALSMEPKAELNAVSDGSSDESKAQTIGEVSQE